MLRILIVLVAAWLGACASMPPGEPQTQVMVVAAIHGAHRDHPVYPYEELYRVVREFEPDIVAIEIRHEDLSRGDDYLARNYPLEMRELARLHGSKVRGVDWLGSELEGREVPRDHWAKQSWVKRLEREKAADPAFQSPEADALQERQMEIIRTSTAAGLNDGTYDEVTRSYYRALDRALANTRYAPLATFYRERDRRIAANVVRIVGENEGRRIAVVLGADHRAPVIDELRRRFGSQIAIVPVR